MKKIVIVGASSGIGFGVAKLYIQAGWQVVVGARRVDRLKQLVDIAPNRVDLVEIDATATDAPNKVLQMLEMQKDADVYLHVAGVGNHNLELNLNIEADTLKTNGLGFVQCVVAAFNFFKERGGGHIAVVSSIAGTKGLGSTPAYSATKRLQNIYIQSLARLSKMTKANIMFTDIRPGFIATDLLDMQNNYPMILDVDYACRRIFKALNKRRRVVVIDWKYWFVVIFWRCIPNFIWERLPWKL